MSEDQRAQKSAVVDDVRGRFDEAEAVLITEYRGLDVGQMAELRSALREAETVYKIYKNTLVRRALDEGIPSGLVDLLVGPTALAFVEKDPGEGDDWIALGRVGIAACEVRAQINGGKCLTFTFCRGLHDLAGGIGEGGCLECSFDVSHFHVANAAFQLA